MRLDTLEGASTRELALLVRLKLATFIPISQSTIGDSMSDDRSSALRLVTPPASEPVTLAQAKTFLRIEHAADDEAVTRAIAAARVAAEQYLRQALLPQAFDFIQANPCPTQVQLSQGPAQSITSVTLTNEAGATSAVNAANYRLSVDGFTVFFAPSIDTEKVTVRYVAGMAATVSDIPAMIVQGILHHVATIVEQRNGAAPMPMQSVACYQPYRRVSL